MIEYEKYERYEKDEFVRSQRYEKYENPSGSYVSSLTPPTVVHSNKVKSTTQTTREAMSDHPELLRVADALKARFAARLTYLATASYTAGKPPQPATAVAFTEYRHD